ncbi:hypothetical protein BJ322DRAFT_528207 [Thelephora terrestris]|uniref:F-box domain-containing protein n=1 Tax=Thelephora terrestris TaxID=56493 RepID=A0A9P6L9Z0_9AGAM|nr:hypothetical protein BJ322DRAFT_528207 [Thelephora terrestris]
MLMALQLDVLEGNVLEVLRLLRSTRNALAPISRIPPEVLAHIPDFWDHHGQDVITLTHVCQAWRDIFTSRSSLWIDFDCNNPHKTRVYLERSKSFPIRVVLLESEIGDLPLDDSALEIVSGAIGRLGSLAIDVAPEKFQDITNRLFRSAPLLESLDILMHPPSGANPNLVLPPLLFDGDLSSLRNLHLQGICTELPWRNMVNLISFQLGAPSSGEISLTHLLDFLEGAPRLLKVEIYLITLAEDAQRGRMVSLPRLKSISVRWLRSPSALLYHLVMPAGVKVAFELFHVEDFPPETPESLRSLSDFKEIRIKFSEYYEPSIRFTGSNGKANFKLYAPQAEAAWHTALELLGLLDVSKTEHLELICSGPISGDVLYAGLLRMTNLHTLTISQCHNLSSLVCVLDPDRDPSNVLVCPKLEKLILYIGTEREFDTLRMTNMAAARASRGSVLKFVRITSRVELAQVVLGLREQVLHLECESTVDDEDVSDEEDPDEVPCW